MEVARIKNTSDFELDARVDKKVWNDAKELTLLNSLTGGEVDKKATAKAAWSENGLYVLFQVDDDHIWGTFQEDDEPIYEQEVVELFIGRGEKVPREYFEFQFSPKGVKFDAKISNPTGSRHDAGFDVDKDWNAIGAKFFQTIEEKPGSTNEYKKGIWVTEVFIPWIDMGWEAQVGDKFRANFFRIDGYPEQSSFQSWVPTLQDPPNFHVPEKFGLIELV